MTDLQSQRNLIMGTIAAQAALGTQAAAQALYEAGGKDLLAGAVQSAVRRACTRSALDVVTVMAPTLLIEGAAETTAAAMPSALRQLTTGAGVVVAGSARAASGQILRGAARVGGVGLLIDGAFGAFTGLRAYRRGTMTGKQAALHTATEAGTGAVSSATGVALAAGVIALTGSLAAPAVMAIGAGGALVTKLGLGRLFARKPAATPASDDLPLANAALPSGA
jgi:hypothetical protein